MSDYQVVREKAASQRRDVERALTRFMAKTGETQSLFKDDITAFPREKRFRPNYPLPLTPCINFLLNQIKPVLMCPGAGGTTVSCNMGGWLIQSN